ncbi:fluoride efflux transporter FluC [Weissella halotolerans]|uniref:Fluoride-specific ion channel FluC n=1 Tax=Weissella halotolerans DSM 20190 TaxID=1123500 RepID=A0A0R2G014_9LACO|nr:CrcB family protein [Weissella halotolerans]KRN31781.1 hypothetical protein IV68_GL001038 [Weissella halotolerans DSM 20190]
MTARFWTRLMAVALGGFFGGALREAVELVVTLPGYPLGTVVVNLTGTFLSAFLTDLFADHWHFSQEFADFTLVGVLGAYTTFSTSILDMATRLSLMAATGYLVLSVLGSVGMVLLARRLAKEVK